MAATKKKPALSANEPDRQTKNYRELIWKLGGFDKAKDRYGNQFMLQLDDALNPTINELKLSEFLQCIEWCQYGGEIVPPAGGSPEMIRIPISEKEFVLIYNVHGYRDNGHVVIEYPYAWGQLTISVKSNIVNVKSALKLIMVSLKDGKRQC